ncbi:MAG: DUF1189 family protein [Deltaproteobacteria bacterium]|nr:DUF1189 family protein [Deltaproteobacteria bacterium]
MSVARSICTMRGGVLVTVILSCVAVSVLSVVLSVFPKVEKLLTTAAGKYDAIFPEITIHNGHASIRERQPHFLEDFGENELVWVIDTRDGSQNEAANYLKGAKSGAVLTGGTVIIKNDGEIRIISLKDVPDMVLNSENIKSTIEELLPQLTRWGIIVIAIYFTMVKTIQAIVLALIPYWGARYYSVPMTYAEAVKIAVVGMIPPVLLDFVNDLFGAGISTSVFVYFISYVAVMVVASMNLFRDSRLADDQSIGIHPS